MVDVIMDMRWYSIADKETWALIYFVNFMFDLHDIFIGSFIAQRLVRTAKRVLTNILETRGSKIN